MAYFSRIFLYLFFGITVALSAQQEHSIRHRRSKNPCGKVKNILAIVGKEIIGIHRNLFDWDSLKVITGIFPLFVSSRMIDEKVQSHFYDWEHHKNIDLFPKWCHDAAEWSVAVPIILLGLQGLLARDEELHETGITFLVGMPFVIMGKDLIKKFRFKACLRPWNEHFGCEKRSSGGFPSGHAAEVTYMAMLYGMRYGPKYALPLGALGVGVGVAFLACNRHYLSQLVAGAGLGAIYALAAHKFIDSKLYKNKDIAFGISANKHGTPTLRFSYSF